MHTLKVLLTKADNIEEARENVEAFLEPYGEGDVWDWYSVGGRWTNYLAPKDKVKGFYEIIHEKYPQTKGYYVVNEIENEEIRPIIQGIWEEQGLEGKNPFWDAYGFSLNEDEPYNIIALKDCLPVVQDFVKDLDKEKEELWSKMETARNEAKQGQYDMTGYYAGQYKDAQYGSFCFETNVYDIDEDVAETIPEDINNYYAVVVDLHN